MIMEFKWGGSSGWREGRKTKEMRTNNKLMKYRNKSFKNLPIWNYYAPLP
jgi:hypothetical protein